MFLSWKIDIKLCQNYTKSYIYQISYKIRINHIQQIRNQSENYYIIQEPENLGFAPVIIFNFYFALLIDIIDNITTYSLYSRVLRHQNFRQ